MGRIFLLSVFILFIISCKSNQIENIEIIDLTDGLKNTKTIYLSEITSDVEYISFETTENSLIGSFEQVKFCNGYIFVQDPKSKTIHVFDNQGKHLSKINKNGRGPGEYLNLSDLEIYQKDTSVFILDAESDKILNYSFKGEFFKEWKIPEEYESAFCLLSGPSFIFFTPYPNNAFNDGFSLSVYDNDLILVNKYINKDILPKQIAFSMNSHRMFTLEECCDTLTFWEYKKDIVYKILDKEMVIPKYKIIYPDPLPLNENISKTKDYNSLYEYFETCNYMFFGGNYKDYPFRIIYSKKTKVAVTISLNSADELNYGFINDIDGGYTFYPEGVTSDGKLFCTFSMFKLKRFLSQTTNIKKTVLSEQKRTELMKLVENSKLQDNNYLMLITLK